MFFSSAAALTPPTPATPASRSSGSVRSSASSGQGDATERRNRICSRAASAAFFSTVVDASPSGFLRLAWYVHARGLLTRTALASRLFDGVLAHLTFVRARVSFQSSIRSCMVVTLAKHTQSAPAAVTFQQGGAPPNFEGRVHDVDAALSFGGHPVAPFDVNFACR